MVHYIDTDEHIKDVEKKIADKKKLDEEKEKLKYPNRVDDCLFDVAGNCTCPVWEKYLKKCSGKENCGSYISLKTSTEKIE